MTVVGYFDGKNLKTFTGLLRCVADTKVNDPDRDVLPYERILLYDNKPLSRLPREVKNSISHRSEAFRKLGIFLSKQRSE
jgi:inosine/xanthosine triphosphate pyrophosphatase family protein